jgi:hypothetical protein
MMIIKMFFPVATAVTGLALLVTDKPAAHVLTLASIWRIGLNQGIICCIDGSPRTSSVVEEGAGPNDHAPSCYCEACTHVVVRQGVARKRGVADDHGGCVVQHDNWRNTAVGKMAVVDSHLTAIKRTQGPVDRGIRGFAHVCDDWTNELSLASLANNHEACCVASVCAARAALAI